MRVIIITPSQQLLYFTRQKIKKSQFSDLCQDQQSEFQAKKLIKTKIQEKLFFFFIYQDLKCIERTGHYIHHPTGSVFNISTNTNIR